MSGRGVCSRGLSEMGREVAVSAEAQSRTLVINSPPSSFGWQYAHTQHTTKRGPLASFLAVAAST